MRPETGRLHRAHADVVATQRSWQRQADAQIRPDRPYSQTPRLESAVAAHGVIGAVCGLIAMWVVSKLIEDPNIYIAVGIASFFGAFFGSLFCGNAKIEVKATE